MKTALKFIILALTSLVKSKLKVSLHVSCHLKRLSPILWTIIPLTSTMM